MGLIIIKIRWFLGSFAPLFLITALRFMEPLVSLMLTCLAVGSAISLLLLVFDLHRVTRTAIQYQIGSIDDRGADVAGYLVGYLLPFLMPERPDFHTILVKSHDVV